MVPDHAARCPEIEVEHEGRPLRRNLVPIAGLIVLPGQFEVAHPTGDAADDVDLLAVIDEALRRVIDAQRLDAGLGVEGVGMRGDERRGAVLQKPMDHDQVAPGEFLTIGHLVADDLAAMAHGLEVEVLNPAAGLAGAGRGLPDLAKPPAKRHESRLGPILKPRTVHLVKRCHQKDGISLELCDAKGWTKRLHDRRQEVGNDVMGVIEFDGRQEPGVDGNVPDERAGRFRPSQHGRSPKTPDASMGAGRPIFSLPCPDASRTFPDKGRCGAPPGHAKTVAGACSSMVRADRS